MDKIRIVQKTYLISEEELLKAIESSGYITFLLRIRNIFLVTLIHSGTNAISDNQLTALMVSEGFLT